MSRIYMVIDRQNDGKDSTIAHKFLVDADSQHQAVGVVVGTRYEAKAATTKEVAELMSAGVEILSPKKREKSDTDVDDIAPVDAIANAVAEPDDAPL